MDSTQQKFLFRQFFKLRIHEAYGDTFQSIFSTIMSYSNSGFQSITPWGNWGDGGNDGWIESESHYFQVYGPKPTTKISELDAIKKALQDFEKIPKKWGEVKKYSFVMNDRFMGVPAPLSAALIGLKKDKNLSDVSVIGGHKLMEMFMLLSDDIKQDIVGGVPTESFSFIDHRAVGELLTFLSEKSNSGPPLLNEIAPVFENKILINKIGNYVRSRLESNSYQSHIVDEFLIKDSGLSQSISNEVKDIYKQSKMAITDECGLEAADLRYFWMVDNLIPPIVHEQHPHSLAAYRIAAELILAKYFETCDAYEHPNNVVTS